MTDEQVEKLARELCKASLGYPSTNWERWEDVTECAREGYRVEACYVLEHYVPIQEALTTTRDSVAGMHRKVAELEAERDELRERLRDVSFDLAREVSGKKSAREAQSDQETWRRLMPQAVALEQANDHERRLSYLEQAVLALKVDVREARTETGLVMKKCMELEERTGARGAGDA